MKNIINYCNKTIIGLLIATIIVVPLFFDIRLYSVFDLSKVNALYMLTIAIVAVWSILLALKHDFKFSHTAIDIPILAYTGIFIISSLTSINPIMSLFGTYKRFEGLTATLCYILVFYTTVNFITTRKRFYLLIISILAGVTTSSVYGIVQHFGYDMFRWSSEGPRIFSTFGNPVFFSAYLIMTLPLAVALFFNNPAHQKETHVLKSSHLLWIFFALSALIYTTFWLTNTRACFVALMGGLAPFLVIIFKKHTVEKYKFIVLVITFILIGIFFNAKHETSVIKHFAGDVRTAETRAEKVFDEIPVHKRPWLANKLSVGGSSFSRIFQYLAATRIIKDYPALGIGPDTIGILYQRNLARVFYMQEDDEGFRFPRQDRIHNDILDTASTRGIFGIGTYIWVLLAFGLHVGKNYKQLSNRDKLLMLGLFAGIVSYLIQNEFSFGNTPIVTLFWVMMGLCISIVKINERELRVNADTLVIEGSTASGKLAGSKSRKTGHAQSISPKTSTIRIFFRWVCCGIVLTAMGFISIFVLRAYRADAYFEYGRRILEYERGTLNTITEKGIFFLKHAVLLNPYETFYRDELCRTYIQMSMKTLDETWVQRAYAEANNSLRVIPQHYMGFYHLGMIYQILAEHFNRNTTGLAIDSYKKAIESDPFQAPFHSNLASLYINGGNLDQAIEELRQAYFINPRDLNHADRLANAYLQKGDMDKALIFARKTVALNPSEPGYHNNLGAILSKKGMYNEAIRAFKKAIEINPKEPIYLDNVAKLYLSLGRFDESIPCYKKLTELDPSVPDYHNNLGVVYKRKDLTEKAIQSFQRAVALKPDNPVFVHNLASTYSDTGKHNDAKDVLQTFNKRYPKHSYINIHLLLADIYSKNTDWENVVSECEHAIKIDNKSSLAHRMLGIAYFNMHQYELAGKLLNQTIALDPNDQAARDLITKIPEKTKKDL